MVGDSYWATGITVKYNNGEWWLSVQFFDSGFCQDDSTEGELRLRYWVKDLSEALFNILADASRLGITWRSTHLYAYRDGEDKDYPMPDNWRNLLADYATGIGWTTPYTGGI